MSYSSRVYRQRNAHTQDEKSNDAFFSKKNDAEKSKSEKSFFQAKLSVNKPGDKFEKEADSVADAVANKSSQKSMLQQKKISSVQRLATSAEDEKLSTNDARMQKDKEIQEKPMQNVADDAEKEKKKPVQKMDKPGAEKEKEKKPVQKMNKPGEKDKEKEKKPVQAKQDSDGSVAPSKVSSKIENNAGKGKRLPAKTLNEMNSSFGVDFDSVKIHNDNDAAEMNKELNAQAFTHGEDIYFNEGKFDPENLKGKNLLAHELTHVVQQNSD